MCENIFNDCLTRFKINEKPEALLLIADNPEYIKLVIAWTNLNIKYRNNLTDIKGESEKNTWDWLWENVEFSKKELIDILGTHLTELALDSKLKPLIGNRVIYPDGTMNSYVQRYLRGKVLNLFDTKTLRNKKVKNSISGQA
jgi:hypothetical protein